MWFGGEQNAKNEMATVCVRKSSGRPGGEGIQDVVWRGTKKEKMRWRIMEKIRGVVWGEQKMRRLRFVYKNQNEGDGGEKGSKMRFRGERNATK